MSGGEILFWIALLVLVVLLIFVGVPFLGVAPIVPVG
jgi:hypothetical protein